MNELSSFLGAPIEPTAPPKMRMEIIELNAFDSKWCTTRFEMIDKFTNKAHPIRALAYKIDHEPTLGYIPTKCWHGDGTYKMMYYVSSALPSAARPFGNEPCYVFLVPASKNHTIEYDSETRNFIDQISTPDAMMYMFIFGEKEMQKVLTTHWSGEPWEKANPILSEWDKLSATEWDDPDGGK